MSKRSFQVLLDRLCEEWRDSACNPEIERMGIFSGGSSVSAKTRLAITFEKPLKNCVLAIDDWCSVAERGPIPNGL